MRCSRQTKGWGREYEGVGAGVRRGGAGVDEPTTT